jgi:hypothetical protein
VDEIRNPGNINEIKSFLLDPGSRPPSGLGRDDELRHRPDGGEDFWSMALLTQGLYRLTIPLTLGFLLG